ncbi:hypothetical protein NLJ89_g9404 [Agrocybe chaxingu]|uniref:Membrane insertase YidC/Oxa/ALB C-terminal domain-containing protein n=1 Tax=Agrocybe chaxingu TaxID=84603 RepID=A0A9W8JSI0_9AGAR|nr:hypothetical protein NLJ89_g9404 [Agrocybe chaxingu]
MLSAKKTSGFFNGSLVLTQDPPGVRDFAGVLEECSISSFPDRSLKYAFILVFVADSAASLDSSSAFESVSSTITDTLIQNAPAALQYGDFAAMGLAGWSPAGFVRWSFEIINVTTGLPWFWTIVAGSAFWRLACVPFALKGLQASARMQPLQPQIMQLQQNVKRASDSRDRLALQKASLAMSAFYKDNGINPFAGFISLIQMPITLGIFFGVQKMCKLPVEQLTQSGFALFPDLTVVDPTLVLPIALCAAVNMQISLGARDVNTIERPGMGHFMNAMRILTIPGIWFMSSFPVGLLVSLLTTASLTIAQTLALRSPAIRRALDIPIPPPETRGKLPSMSSTPAFIKKFLWDDVMEATVKKQKEESARQRTRMKKRF